MARLLICSALTALAVSASACDRRSGPPAPPADFLAAAGESLFWIQGGPRGISVRGSALLLAHVDGRFYEIYVADDDRSFHDALFVGHRLFRRDLITGDSLLLFQDTLIPTLARVWAEANPEEQPLGPEDIASSDPSTIATAELVVLDVHGPFLSYEYHADIETIEGVETHSTRRGVLDLRSGEQATLGAVFGTEEGARIAAEGARRFTEALDSVRHARGESAARAALALTRIRFDPTGFTLARRDSLPAVAFHIPGDGPDAEGLGIELPIIAAAPPPWWADAARALPDVTLDDAASGTESWATPQYTVLAHYEEASDTVHLVIRDTAGADWDVGRLQAPLHRIYWLDRPPIDSLTRRALLRAFDEATLYSEGIRMATDEPAPLTRPRRPSAPSPRAPAAAGGALLAHGTS